MVAKILHEYACDMSKDVVENYINNQKYNALQKKKRPNGR